ncbi:hypothetical protein KAJ83_10705 [Marivibrio halodurans]|uniref:Uncharacterized protein n=1 Tax=Marivibrio halodurans TaxID=2039722 RepID=A0A8J7V4A6_9PROT|nr:hypothetical protein [Marivibrio halodurans]MBP5857479.1 hypothetical protein [Marivibrio halodurans]
MLRGNDTNFYIRCDDDLDDIDTDSRRGPLEYPHIHAVTDGPTRWNRFVYIGITFGTGTYHGAPAAIDIFRDDAYQLELGDIVAAIQGNLPLISYQRVQNLARFLRGFPIQQHYQ